MDWQEKLSLMAGLGRISLRMRSPGNWYVEQVGVEFSDGLILRNLYGNGATPRAAVEEHWLLLTDLSAVIVTDAHDPGRRLERQWDGHRWVSLDPNWRWSKARAALN